MEDKCTGKDTRLKSKEFIEAVTEDKIIAPDIVPSGALPSPTETPHPEEVSPEQEHVYFTKIVLTNEYINLKHKFRHIKVLLQLVYSQKKAREEK